MLSVPGAGECPIGIASSPFDNEYIEFTVKRYQYGTVTSALHNLRPGAHIGVRGPYGNSFPMDEMKGKNIIIIGGGFAFTTLRSTIQYITDGRNRSDYKNITIIYGARNPGELLYKQEISEWQQRADIAIHITVDKADNSWTGNRGFVPDMVKKANPSPLNSIVLVCGPPLMLKFTLPVLLGSGFHGQQLYTSLERKMSCGIGKCGKCNIETKYVCKDGPVFNYEEIREQFLV